MKSIFKIARQELSILFYSPVAWLVLIIFPIQAGLDLTKFLQMAGRATRMGQEFTEITSKIFEGNYGFYAGVKNALYLYIPLLTMGLISREINSGTIKLLLSSPIKVIDIVLGKYLAMLVYGLILLFIIGLFGLAGAFAITNMDYGLVISGALGMYLLICTYSAIGLFMSSLTSYQVVAAISTLAVLGVLNFVGTLFQGVDMVRQITYFLSISGRTEQAMGGLISSEDIIYFFIVTCVFLILTVLRLHSWRERKPFLVKFVRYFLLVAACFLVGYVSSRPSLTIYKDMTATKTRTLNANSISLIKKMTKPLRIITYINILDENYYMGKPESKSDDEKFFMQYRRFMPDLKMDYIYYYDVSKNVNLYKDNPGLNDSALARKVADIQGLNFKNILSPAEIKKIVNLAPEENRLVRELIYGNERTFLRYFNDMMRYPSEQEITTAIKRVVEPSKTPTVTFLTGNEERSVSRAGDEDYRTVTSELTFRHSLINQGFNVETIRLDSNDLLDKSGILVIADPKIQFSITELEKLKQYINKGGNLLLTSEPGGQSIVNPVLANLGLQLENDTIFEISKDFAPNFILSTFTDQAANYSTKFNTFKDNNGVVSMPGVSGLKVIDEHLFKKIPILEDRKKNPVAISLTRNLDKKEQRIMIIGDADFMSSAELNRGRPVTKNFDFITNIFSWFSYGEFPVDNTRPKTRDEMNVVNSDENGLLGIRIIFFGILPALFLIGGTILLFYRKRR